MKNSFKKHLNKLQAIAHEFGESSAAQKISLLQQLKKADLHKAEDVVSYYHLLLFLYAYPDNEHIHLLVEKEFKRIATYAKKLKHTHNALPDNEGLPYTNIVTRFSPSFLQWLLTKKDIQVAFDSFYQPELPLNDILKATLPSLLKPETTAGLSNEALLEVLGVKPADYASFLMGQLNILQNNPDLREMINEKMMLYVQLIPKNESFSLAYNRLAIDHIYFHNQLLKKLDVAAMVEEPLSTISTEQVNKDDIYTAVRNAMALTVREIDPATFLQTDTIKLFNVGRGVQVALYSMEPAHQLPLETYFGFTFFKNGLPVSYGGIWAFGSSCKLGLNVFEPYRLGESGYLLCQLMRLCTQVLGCRYFEIEPSQFGLDNPDGIKSGAFWFYHKFGFRPIDNDLFQLAANEHHKVKTKKGYRSSEDTLIRFTEANIAVHLAKGKIPLRAIDVMAKVLAYMKKDWANNYANIKATAIDKFCAATSLNRSSLSAIQLKTLEETALWAAAYKINKPRQLVLMRQMVMVKTYDDYAYQQLLLTFFND